MVEGKINKKVITNRASWVQRMIDSIKDLPLENKEEFFKDPRNVASAESYLRRALEALLDLGRHILAKGFAIPITEYKDIAKTLIERKVLPEYEGKLLLKMAGYRNRMVHFYQEITPEEIYEISKEHLDEIRLVLDKMLEWLKENKEKMDEEIFNNRK
ncbi:MAG: type VII toxin-antitoxin system HepT family RNase toxin [Candidatus Njordarchaeales archaeon]